MAVKTAPEQGTVVEEVKRTRTIPASEDDSNKPWRSMAAFDYLASLTTQQWQDHVVYLYRYDDKGNTWALGKFLNAIDEFKVMEQFGGGCFNMKVKKGPMLILNHDFQIEGNPKTPPASGTVSGVPGNETALLTAIGALVEELKAARGGSVAQDAIKQAVGISGQVFSAGVEAVKSTLSSAAPAQPPAPDPFRDMQARFMEAAIAKMLNPADPIEQFAKMVTAMNGLGFGKSDSRGGVALELVRQVPTVAQSLARGLEQWRFAEEARARTAVALRGPVPMQVHATAPAAAPANVVPMPPPAAAAASASAEQTGSADAQTPPGKTLEEMLCDIVEDESLTVEQAANEAAALIERAMPGQTDVMVRYGEDSIFNFFRTHPGLQRVAEHPRLRDFIKKFCEVVKSAPVVQTPNSTAPPA
jgi:hypothetical protein